MSYVITSVSAPFELYHGFFTKKHDTLRNCKHFYSQELASQGTFCCTHIPYIMRLQIFCRWSWHFKNLACYILECWRFSIVHPLVLLISSSSSLQMDFPLLPSSSAAERGDKWLQNARKTWKTFCFPGEMFGKEILLLPGAFLSMMPLFFFMIECVPNIKANTKSSTFENWLQISHAFSVELE